VENQHLSKNQNIIFQVKKKKKMSDDGSVECPMAKRMKLIENYNPIKNDINVPATGGGLNKDEKLGESLRNFHVLDEVNENDSDDEQEGELMSCCKIIELNTTLLIIVQDPVTAVILRWIVMNSNLCWMQTCPTICETRKKSMKRDLRQY
jgi:hypothetical protein